jgi:hypothetical protein
VAGTSRDALPGEEAALRALAELGLAHEVLRHGRVGSLAEAAAARGVEPADVVKTIVVRRGEGDFLFVLVPGDRTIAWPKLRALLGVQRLSMPDADTAFAVTGYRRGADRARQRVGQRPAVALQGLAPEDHLSEADGDQHRRDDGEGAVERRPGGGEREVVAVQEGAHLGQQPVGDGAGPD